MTESGFYAGEGRLIRLSAREWTVIKLVGILWATVLLSAATADAQQVKDSGGTRHSVAETTNTSKRSDRYATRSGNIIQVQPSGATFQIPNQWEQVDIEFRLTRRELRNIRRGDPSRSIADSVFAFRDCAAQIELYNGSPWVRAYIVDSSPDEVLRRIKVEGPKAASKIPGFIPGRTRGYQVEPATEGLWQHIDVPYYQHIGDVGEGGAVGFFVRSLPNGQLVIVVGFRGNEREGRVLLELKDLLNSVVIP